MCSSFGGLMFDVGWQIWTLRTSSKMPPDFQIVLGRLAQCSLELVWLEWSALPRTPCQIEIIRTLSRRALTKPQLSTALGHRCCAPFTLTSSLASIFPPTDMPSSMLKKSLTAAETLRTRCQTVPDLNAYQPLVTSAVELCVSGAPSSRKRVSSLAVYSVKKTTALVQKGINFPLTPERQQGLETFERALDSIRRYIESMPRQGSSKSLKFSFSAVTFDRESWRLKGSLNAAYKNLTELPKKSKLALHSPCTSGVSRTECLIEIATVGTRIAGATRSRPRLCEARICDGGLDM
ncbi:hypothetical protein C8R47DRAFT_1160260 [Mycena vitilis]|nr:hypothetical protein C8R47DRAFT_1160260 [Mycena vitilis]